MKFRSEFSIESLHPPIHFWDGIMLEGSCFSEAMGEKLKAHKFKVLENGHGILFNPVSVANSLVDYIDGKEYSEKDLFFLNEAWHSWNHHSRFSSPDKEESLQKINASNKQSSAFLKSASHLIITLGSAWTYALTSEAQGGNAGQVVANNHKAPSTWFHKKLMSPDEILQVLDPLIHRLFHFNPDLTIIFTISPVRHIREGLINNNRSKAALIYAVHHLVNKFDKLYYFPSYEIVIDDLRDYRFYSEDLVHPNYAATRYVWEKFVASCIDRRASSVFSKIEEITLARNHKPFNPKSQGHLKFLQSFLQKTIALGEEHPYLDLKDEKDFFSGQISQSS